MNNKTILLVEDNPDDVKLTLRAFKNCNIANEVTIAHDGVEALEMLASLNPLPTVTLLDLNLPRLSGLEVLKRIRADARLKRLPVLILTSSKEDQDILKSYDNGANSYIRKPVEFEQFTEAVRQLGLYWLLLNEGPPEGKEHPCKSG
jgi:two-component system response regulator